MLNLYLPTLLFLIVSYLVLFIFFIFSLNNNRYVFYKVWVVFFYLLLQCVLIGYFGEDFYIVVVLSAEIPVFFSFFFFCVFKTQIGAVSAITPKFFTIKKIVTITFILFLFYLSISNVQSFQYFYYTPETVISIPQRSDFFIYYLSFFYFSPQIIIFIGLLISVVTLILLVFTFRHQIVNNTLTTKKKNINWVRTQDISIQNNQKRSFVFFKL
jgi:hypothetical protein